MKAVCFFQGFLHILHKRNSTDLSAQIKKQCLAKNQISVVESWGKKNEHEEAKRRAENNVS